LLFQNNIKKRLRSHVIILVKKGNKISVIEKLSKKKKREEKSVIIKILFFFFKNIKKISFFFIITFIKVLKNKNDKYQQYLNMNELFIN